MRKQSVNQFNYTLGIGAMRTYHAQEGKSRETYIFKPSVRLSYAPCEGLFFRYNGYISGYSPSLSDLNDISQPIDLLQVFPPKMLGVQFIGLRHAGGVSVFLVILGMHRQVRNLPP